MHTKHYIKRNKIFHQTVDPADKKIITAGNKTTKPVVAKDWMTAVATAHRASLLDIFFSLWDKLLNALTGISRQTQVYIKN